MSWTSICWLHFDSLNSEEPFLMLNIVEIASLLTLNFIKIHCVSFNRIVAHLDFSK